MAVWDDVIPEEDLEIFRAGGFGKRRLLGDRAAILVVDMSYGGVNASNGRGVGECGETAAVATRPLLRAGRDAGLPIIFTHAMWDNSAAGIGMRKGAQRAAQCDDRDYELLPALDVQPHELVLPKRRPSAFFGTDLVNVLVYHAIDSLIVTGVTTSGCVRATVVDAYSYNYRVWVPEECVADRARLSHKVSLFDIQMKYADVVPVADALLYVESLTRRGRGSHG